MTAWIKRLVWAVSLPGGVSPKRNETVDAHSSTCLMGVSRHVILLDSPRPRKRVHVLLIRPPKISRYYRYNLAASQKGWRRHLEFEFGPFLTVARSVWSLIGTCDAARATCVSTHCPPPLPPTAAQPSLSSLPPVFTLHRQSVQSSFAGLAVS